MKEKPKTKIKKDKVKSPPPSIADHRPLLAEGNKLKPTREIFNGFEIEKRWLLATHEEDYTKKKNSISLYDKTLRDGKRYEQGYITDEDKMVEVAQALGIIPDFKPKTMRLRKIGTNLFILTLKDKKETKRREVEWELDQKTFKKFWPLTKGHRVYKTRTEKETKNGLLVMDAFTDRYLLMAEIEVKDEKSLDDLPKLGFDVTKDSSWSNKALSK
jgi:CYTH domain-containing protein